MSNQNRLSRLIGKNWLSRYTKGLYSSELTDLGDDIFDEICKFTVLWQLFEKLVLNKYIEYNQEGKEIREGPAKKIKKTAKNWSDAGKIADDEFLDSLNYFRNRYVDDGKLNHRFVHLDFQNDSNRKSVEKALKRKNHLVTTADVSGVLILVCQYRHRLFHAEKDLTDQKENFERANAVLKKAIEKEWDCI